MLFATAVDRETLLVRGAPETGLRVIPFEGSAHAQLFITLPGSWPALTPDEASPLHEYFSWTDDDAFWWRTQRPAVISLEEVSHGIWAGHVIEKGVVQPAGDDLAAPPIHHQNVFRVWQTPRAHVPARWRPAIHERDGQPVTIWSSKATRTVEATFPAYGPDTVWLRTFMPGEENPSRRILFNEELTVLRQLHDAAPTRVVEVMHSGELQTTRGSGGYMAQRRSIAVPLPSYLVTRGCGDPQAFVLNIAQEVALLAAVLHAAGNCIGPVTPAIFGVRPGLINDKLGVRVQLVAAPGAGPIGKAISANTAPLLPPVGGWRIVGSGRGIERSTAADIGSIGRLMLWLLERVGITDAELLKLAHDTAEGRVQDANVLARTLAAAIDR